MSDRSSFEMNVSKVILALLDVAESGSERLLLFQHAAGRLTPGDRPFILQQEHVVAAMALHDFGHFRWPIVMDDYAAAVMFTVLQWSFSGLMDRQLAIIPGWNDLGRFILPANHAPETRESFPDPLFGPVMTLLGSSPFSEACRQPWW
jgi:hypothetical protein